MLIFGFLVEQRNRTMVCMGSEHPGSTLSSDICLEKTQYSWGKLFKIAGLVCLPYSECSRLTEI